MTKALLKFVLPVVVALFCFTALAIVIDGFNDQVKISDVAVVFGNQVNPDGSVSPRLASRLDKTVELYNTGLFRHVIVSGGTGSEGVDEAVAMQKYLVTHHIPASAILVDSQGNNTSDTAKNSAIIMQQHGFRSALLVSQYFHLSRVRLAFKQCGISMLYKAHSHFFEWRDIYSLAREVAGFYYYVLKPQECR